jgi:hypothetical protein
MASIDFLPVCSNCRAILDDQYISIEEEIVEIPIRAGLVGSCQYYVKPPQCPACGEYFVSITIPNQLPFEPRRKSPL